MGRENAGGKRWAEGTISIATHEEGDKMPPKMPPKMPSKMAPKQPNDPNPRAALRVAIAYLRDEAVRIGLPSVARALERALKLLDGSR
jgi:hypothetical protein